MITDYVILESNNTTELSKQVMQKIKEGYTLYGDPFCYAIHSSHYCQAMTTTVKRDSNASASS